MSQLLYLGGLNKKTLEYVYPKIANKRDEYMCPECNKDLVLCQGIVRSDYFRHKVDINPCNYYSHPSESQIHKDAKMLLKKLLDTKIPITFIRQCCSCKKNKKYKIVEITESSNIQLEYRFEYNGLKIADVAYIDNNELLCIFEICNTHKTSNQDRPEPWFEIEASSLIKLVNNDNLTDIQIQCIRLQKCKECIEDEKYIFYSDKEKIRYENIIKEFNRTKGCNYNFSYIHKYKVEYGYNKNLLKYVIKCDEFINNLIRDYEKNIYISSELDKKIFEECYYSKYHRVIKTILKYGRYWNHILENDGEQLWGGWGGNTYINNGCYKPTMYKFLKHYNLINPMNIEKYLQNTYA